MPKPLSNAKYKEFIKSLPVDKQFESVERSLRVLPQEIMDEVARVPQLPSSPKVIKFLESRLKQEFCKFISADLYLSFFGVIELVNSSHIDV